MNGVPADQTSSASGLVATTRAVGQALSVAIAGATFIGFGGAAAALSVGSPTAAAVAALDGTFLDALRAALLVSGLMAATGAVTSVPWLREGSVEASPSGRGAS